MILAVADDISGAAEIAAVGRTFGLTAQVRMKNAGNTSAELVVVDTDTRYSTNNPAGNVSQALAYNKNLINWYYKKVDSVLRGHVFLEISAMMKILNKNRAILAPANPSKARVISNGQYFINEQLLYETDFANDPDYPVTSSNVIELLNAPQDYPVYSRTWKTYHSLEHGIVIAEVQTLDDLTRWADYLDEYTLAVGGSDFFRAILEKKLSSKKVPSHTVISVVSGKKLFVCGSSSDNSKKAAVRAGDSGIPVCPMPDALFQEQGFNDALIQKWADIVLAGFSISDRVIIAILQPVVQDSRLAENLRMKTAALVRTILDTAEISELFIEGGATAEAVLHALQYETFDVLAEYAPGVVQMRVVGQKEYYVTIKPGSYPWPEGIWM
jgi:uncharacterized protein YgbK (DUF1537 family)